MTKFRHTFERLDETDHTKRFIHLTSREFDIFFSGIDHPASLKALAWSEFRHSVGGRMIKVATHNEGQDMTELVSHERNVLWMISKGKTPDNPGALWWTACEALAGRGLISVGQITEKGKEYLQNNS